MRLAFVDPIDWDYQPESVYQMPLGGSQSALCYLVETLAAEGHSIFLLNRNSQPGVSQGVVSLPLNSHSVGLLATLALDAVIVLNNAAIAPQLKPHLSHHTRLVLWTQHATDQPDMHPLCQPATQAALDGIAFVSQWQQSQFDQVYKISVPSRVLRNAIAPCFQNLFESNTEVSAAKVQPPLLVYTSTPFRGLELLLEAFPLIRQGVPQVKLRVFSSLQVYQAEASDDPFQSLYERCRQLPGVDYVGSVPQPQLAVALRQATLLAYPNIFLETSCIAVMEAMAAGCQVVTSALGALPETTAGFATLIDTPVQPTDLTRFASFDPSQKTGYIRCFVQATIAALQAQPSQKHETRLRQQVAWVNQHCTWKQRAQDWLAWLEQVCRPSDVSPLPATQVRKTPDPVEPLTMVAIGQQLAQAAAYGQAGQFAQVEEICQTILQQQPANGDAWHLLGLAHLQRNNSVLAIEALQQAIAHAPNAAEFHNHLGVAYCNQHQFEQGIACYRRALTLQPRPDTLYNLGLALQRQGNLAESATAYQQVVAQMPDHRQAWLNLGNVYHALNQSSQAIACYQKVVVLQPSDPQVWNRLGRLYQSLGNLPEAATAYQRGLSVEPDAIELLNNLGTVLQEQGLPEPAIAHYQKALALQPQFPHALINLGNIFLKLEQFDQAESYYRQLLAIDPTHIKAIDGLVRLLRQTCKWGDLEVLSQQLMTEVTQRLATGQPCEMMPLNSLLLPFTAAQQQAIAIDYAREISQAMAGAQFEVVQRRSSQPIIRLGYVSGDFRNHAVAHLMRQLFKLHDRSQFEVFAYSLGPDDGSDYRSGLMQDCDRFLDISPFTPMECARQIYADRIDVLIDLAGYTTYSCPHLFALRPAPIQVNYLGYPGTMGAEFMDYIIADPVVLPPESRRYFSETVAYLPNSYQINDNQQTIAPAPDRLTLGLPKTGTVFCCFNQTRKIDPTLFAVWMRLLHQVPDSVLWLFRTFDQAEHNLMQTAIAHNIAPERLIFATSLSKSDHLARLQCADLFLDTTGYNGHTTASDALWAGVPVVTLPGETFASRVAASLLHAVNLPELIAADLHDYEAIVLQLAQNAEQLRSLKQRLKRSLPTAPLYNTRQTVRDLETVYHQMWQCFVNHQSPQPIEVFR